jgi:hypothetical protein
MACVLLVYVDGARGEGLVNANKVINIIIDSNGGTYRIAGNWEMNFMETEIPSVPSGSTLAGIGHNIEDDTLTNQGKDFAGWDVMTRAGTMVAGNVTTAQLLNMSFTTDMTIVAQWTPRDSVFTGEFMNFTLWDHDTQTPDNTARVSVVYNGIKYSGYGSLTLTPDIYSSWKGTFQIIIEPNGHYIRQNRKWNPNVDSFDGRLSDFKRMNNVSWQMSTTGVGKDSSPDRKKLNEYIYSVWNRKPEITVLSEVQTQLAPAKLDTAGTNLPANVIVKADQYLSGTKLDDVANLLLQKVGGSSLAVYDIKLADGDGNAISNTGGTVKVALDLPAGYVVPEGKEVVVYYVSDDGKVEACVTVLGTNEAGAPQVVFETNHFSVYAIAEVEKPKPTPTPEPTPEPTPTPTPTPASTADPTPAPGESQDPAATSAPGSEQGNGDGNADGGNDSGNADNGNDSGNDSGDHGSDNGDSDERADLSPMFIVLVAVGALAVVGGLVLVAKKRK